MKSQKVLLFLTAVIAGSIFSAINCSANDELPLMMIRLRAPHTADHVQWSKTFKVLRDKNYGAPYISDHYPVVLEAEI